MTDHPRLAPQAAAGPVLTASAAAADTRFYDAVLPALTSGSYLLSVDQGIAGEEIQAAYRHEQPVRVTGPHFGLAPGDVRAMHPPAGSTADYTRTLPSVVLGNPALPWIVAPGPVGADRQRPAWMALLLLTPDEIAVPEQLGAASLTGTHAVPLADFLAPPEGVVGPVFTAVQRAGFRQENPPDFTVPVVDVDCDAFRAVAPRADELALLAHARLVDPADQETDESTVDTVAVVVGNRLARGSSDGLYIAHLVSVEGFTGYLTPGTVPAGRTVRLISLASWTFTSVPGGRDFPAVMRGLDSGLLRLPGGFTEPRGEGEQLVSQALSLGYAAAEHRTRLGERTVAWYRGPCLPVRMKRNPQPPYGSADGALIYDPRTGIFDVSFAVAWQTGRLSALADREIVVALLRWLRAYQRAGHLALERSALRRSLGLPTTAESDPAGSSPALSPSSAPGPASARSQARAALAAVLARLPRGGADPGVLGPPIDPSGLLAHLARLPGVVPPDELDRLAIVGDPTAAVIAQARAREDR